MKTTDLNTEQLISDLKRVVRDSEELIHVTANVAGDKAHEIRERLTNTLETARETCRGLEEKARDVAKTADKTIRDNPYQSIGVAFGIGLLIGVLTTRK